MVSISEQNSIIDPVDELNSVLEGVWYNLCDTYDAAADMPELEMLFQGADLSRPNRSAQFVIVNMLLDVIESTSRFSPWYTRPARAFGLAAMRDYSTRNQTRWMLAPEAILKWEKPLRDLTETINRHRGLIQAMVLVGDLMENDQLEDPCITARCSCLPPRTIQVTQSVLAKTEIMCHACKQPYY